MWGLYGYKDNPKQLLMDFYQAYYNNNGGLRGAHVIWADCLKNNPAGQQFADLVTELKLGTVFTSPGLPNVNGVHQEPGHLNYIWVWSVDQEALKAWHAEETKPKPTAAQVAIKRVRKAINI